MRWLAVLLVALLLVGAVAATADAWLVSSAEAQAEQRLSEELGTPVEVDLRGGWPTSLSLLGGHIPEVAISAEDVPLEHSDARLAHLDAVLTDIEVSLADLRGSGALPVQGGGGTFVLEIDEANVNLLVSSPTPIRLEDGRGAVELAGRRIEVVPTVESGRVVLRPGDGGAGLQAVPVELPGLPAEVLVERVEVLPGVLRLSGRVLSVSL